MNKQSKPFDGLADVYDAARPRYPQQLFSRLAREFPARPLNVVDAGAGTGIALEGLLPHLPMGSRVHAIDISADMIEVGRRKFPDVEWMQESVEAWLEKQDALDLVVAAQAYQWMDRPAFVSRAARALGRRKGLLVIMQNNRNHHIDGLAADYENLLETMSPGYRRDYRAIDIETETRNLGGRQWMESFEWTHEITVTQFVSMAQSSTQAQRAIAAHGPAFLEAVTDLATSHARGGQVQVAYVTELYVTHAV